jgi:gag-polypeptide of LTR copia-type
MIEGIFTFPTPNQITQISTFLRAKALLNGKNYIPWAKAAGVTLKGKGLLGYVNGSRVKQQRE